MGINADDNSWRADVLARLARIWANKTAGDYNTPEHIRREAEASQRLEERDERARPIDDKLGADL